MSYARLGPTTRARHGARLGGAVRMAVVGIAIGGAGGLAATRAMKGLLFGVTAADPLTFAAVSLMLLVVTVVASYVPARRAMRWIRWPRSGASEVSVTRGRTEDVAIFTLWVRPPRDATPRDVSTPTCRWVGANEVWRTTRSVAATRRSPSRQQQERTDHGIAE